MAKRKRYKKTPKAEVKILQERNWVPVSLAGAAIPSWLSSIPQERLMAVLGSGTYWDYQILKYGNEIHDNVIGGYDVFRYDAKDEPKGYPVNKDHYIILNVTTSDDMYVVLGPTSSDHEWLVELPKIRPDIEITELPDDEEENEDE
jgi:hypothetical protein